MSKIKLRNMMLFDIAVGLLGWPMHSSLWMAIFFMAAGFFAVLWLIVRNLHRSPAPPVDRATAARKAAAPQRATSVPKRNPSRPPDVLGLRSAQVPKPNASAAARLRSAPPAKPVQPVKPVQAAQPKTLPPRSSKGSSRLFVPPSLD